MPKATEDKQPVHMLLDKAILERLDDFRFKYRFQSRTEAARWLLDWALGEKPVPKGGMTC